jgi:hypothetical protein
MALVEWHMQGEEVTHSNCAWGCPCLFNALPTRGHYSAITFLRINRGRYADIPLDGLRWGVLATWPGAPHQGGGTLQLVVDAQADAPQRGALEAIAHGRDTEPGTLIWQIYSACVASILPTLARAIELDIDLPSRTARLFVPGVAEFRAMPIRNPRTGDPHHVRVALSHGTEFTEAEFVNGRGIATGAIPLQFHDTHAHLARVHWSTHGVVRGQY